MVPSSKHTWDQAGLILVSEKPSEEQTGTARSTLKRHLKVAWFSTAITLATYFLLMITIAIAPSFLAQPITFGSSLTIGIIAGIVILIILITVSTIFTVWNNQVDQSVWDRDTMDDHT